MEQRKRHRRIGASSDDGGWLRPCLAETLRHNIQPFFFGAVARHVLCNIMTMQTTPHVALTKTSWDVNHHIQPHYLFPSRIFGGITCTLLKKSVPLRGKSRFMPSIICQENSNMNYNHLGINILHNPQSTKGMHLSKSKTVKTAFPRRHQSTIR